MVATARFSLLFFVLLGFAVPGLRASETVPSSLIVTLRRREVALLAGRVQAGEQRLLATAP